MFKHYRKVQEQNEHSCTFYLICVIYNIYLITIPMHGSHILPFD